MIPGYRQLTVVKWDDSGEERRCELLSSPPKIIPRIIKLPEAGPKYNRMGYFADQGLLTVGDSELPTWAKAEAQKASTDMLTGSAEKVRSSLKSLATFPKTLSTLPESLPLISKTLATLPETL